MGGLVIQNVTSGNGKISSKGIFIVILYANKVPPHIGLCLHDNFFSLKVSGAEIISKEALFRSIQIKKIPSLFVRLNANYGEENLLLMSKNIFESSHALDENTSCLDPIKEWSEYVFSINSNGINSIHDLMPLLKEKDVVMESYGFHLAITAENTYEIEYYGKNEIRARINQLIV